jgi:hypothetical protein
LDVQTARVPHPRCRTFDAVDDAHFVLVIHDAHVSRLEPLAVVGEGALRRLRVAVVALCDVLAAHPHLASLALLHVLARVWIDEASLCSGA